MNLISRRLTGPFDFRTWNHGLRGWARISKWAPSGNILDSRHPRDPRSKRIAEWKRRIICGVAVWLFALSAEDRALPQALAQPTPATNTERLSPGSGGNSQSSNNPSQESQDPPEIRSAKRLLAVTERTLGADHPRVADSLNRIGGFYYKLGRYAMRNRCGNVLWKSEKKN